MNEQVKAAAIGAGYAVAALIFFVGAVNTLGFVMKAAGRAMGCAD
ncbi:hypothetical protein ULG90_24740 [Halopseudomonas pachastrellae]|jgi:hypothetical protein|nr:hypothetical protein ULG90_24740 [Halopseudomonas pachastrellae]